jgi:hypothetical protein
MFDNWVFLLSIVDLGHLGRITRCRARYANPSLVNAFPSRRLAKLASLIDYGINAFKVRDHPAAENYDAMSAAVRANRGREKGERERKGREKMRERKGREKGERK